MNIGRNDVEANDRDAFMLKPAFASIRVQHIAPPRRFVQATASEFETRLLSQLARCSFDERLAGLDTTAGELPCRAAVGNAQVARMQEQDAVGRVEDDEAYCVAFDDASQCRAPLVSSMMLPSGSARRTRAAELSVSVAPRARTSFVASCRSVTAMDM